MNNGKGTYNYGFGKGENSGSGTTGKSGRNTDRNGLEHTERVANIRRILASSPNPRPTTTAADSDFVTTVWDILDEAGNLLIRKHHDYGPTNISRSPGGPLNGLRVRMWDKIARINNLIDNDLDPKHESLRDSFIDLLNYSAIALMVLEDKWPKE